MSRLIRFCAAHAVVALAASMNVQAEGARDLEFTVSTETRYDSNLFRLPSNANTQALIGRPSPEETIQVTALGITYQKSYSLQRVELDAQMVNSQYQHFSYLDLSALNYRAAWRWSFTPHLYGNITASRTQALNSFADLQNFNRRNDRTNTFRRADANYELGARWRLLGAIAEFSQSDREPLVGESGSKGTSVDAGVRYTLPSGSSAGFVYRKGDGTYTNRPLLSGAFFDSRFASDERELSLVLAISDKTSADFKIAYENRTNPKLPQRDFGGITGSARFEWDISAKTSLIANWSHNLTAYQTATTNFYQTDRFSLGPMWRVSPKATLRLQVGTSTRDYGGSPGAVAVDQRKDRYTDARMSLDWKPLNYLALNASVHGARRSSNLPSLGFNSNGLELGAKLIF